MKGGRSDKMFEEFRKISSRPVWRKMVFGMVAAIQFSFANSDPGSEIISTTLLIVLTDCTNLLVNCGVRL